MNSHTQAEEAGLQASFRKPVTSRMTEPVREAYIWLALFAADILAVSLLIALAMGCRAVITGHPLGWSVPTSATVYIGVVMLLIGIAGQGIRTGRYNRRVSVWTDMRDILSASLALATALAALGLVTGELEMFAVPITVLLLCPLATGGINPLAKRLLSALDIWTLPVLVVGDRAAADRLQVALEADPSLGYRVVRTIDAQFAASRIDAIGLSTLLELYGARYLALAHIDRGETRQHIIQAAVRAKVCFAAVTGVPASGSSLNRLPRHATLLLDTRHAIKRPAAHFGKAAADVLFALAVLILCSPIFVVIALAVRLDGGPAFYRHRRVGAGGRSFDCLKFRTMVLDSDGMLQCILASDPQLADEWRVSQKLRRDPRVTPLGRLLRSTSLDELPQLLNVLRLEMSLVGPRPIVDAEVAFYGADIAHYYATRPGITGLWQVSGRSNTSYGHRVELDVHYVSTWTVWLDFVVLLKTIPAVLSRDGAH